MSEALPWLIAVLAGALCYGLFIKRGIGLPILGYNISPAERVMHGEVPYRDFVYNYTPGVLWLNAWMMKLLGVKVTTVNVGLFIFKLAALAALFGVARRLTSAKAALIPVALTLGWVGYRVVLRPYPAQYSMLFVMLALLCFLNYDKSEKARWLVLCGAAVGIVFVFKQNVGLLLLASATAAVVIREAMAFPRRSGGLGVTRRTLIFWLGFTMIAAALLIYLAYLGSLRGMLDHFTSLAGDYSEKRAVPLPHIKLLAPVVVGLSAVCAIGVILLRRAPKLFEPFIVLTMAVVAAVLLVPHRAFVIKNSATAAISYLPLVMFILVLASAAWAFGKHRRSLEQREEWWRSFGPIAVVALFAFGAYLEVYPRADYAHLVRTLPPTFLLLLLAAKKGAPALSSWLRDRLQSPRRAAMLCVAAPLALLFIVGIKDTWQPRFDSSFRFVEQTPLRIERARGILVGRKQAEFIENLAAVIEGHSSVDDFIFSFAPRGTAFYFLSSRRNPTRLVWWRSAGIKKEDRDALADQIAAGIPKLLLVPDGFRNDRILDQVSARYHRIDFIGDIAIYERN